jgi:hypothetical protein
MAQLKSGLLRARSAGSGAGDGQGPIAMPGFRGALAFILHFRRCWACEVLLKSLCVECGIACTS